MSYMISYIISISYKGRESMKILTAIKKIISSACVYFTVTEFALLIIINLMAEKWDMGKNFTPFFTIGSAFILLVFFTAIAASNLIFKTKLPTPIAYLIHFLIVTVVYIVLFVLIPGVWQDGHAFAMRLCVFVPVYIIVALVSFIIKLIFNRSTVRDEEYVEQFSDITGKTK